MFSIALIGADGAGKTTIGRRLENDLPIPVKYVYMGVNLDASNHMLPTTRLIRAIKHARGDKPDAGPPDISRAEPRPTNASKQILSDFKSGLRLVNRLSEEWFRQAITWYYKKQGNIVVFDRHFFHDYYAHDVASSSTDQIWSKRIHGFMLQHLYPKPDLVICLDAPADILYARKPEGTLQALERRRQEYLQIQHAVEHFSIVDVSQQVDVVFEEVKALIWHYYEANTARANDHVQARTHIPEPNGQSHTINGRSEQVRIED